MNKVYAVWDAQISSFDQPIFLRSKGEAIRGFADAANDPKTYVGKHPQDYTLFEIAEYDRDKGSFQNHPTPISLGLAIEFVKKEKPENNIDKARNLF